MRKKVVDKNEKLRLTLNERKLILQDAIHSQDKVSDAIRATPTGASVLLTLEHR